MQRVYSDGLNPPLSFNLVYQAALMQSNSHLAHYLSQSIASIDVKAGGKFGIITPAGLHAMHGNDDAVKFLVQHHANIDFIGYGAALANRVETAEYWRKRFGAHPDLLARGAAYAGNLEYAKELNIHYGANSLEIGIGLLMGAHEAQFKTWLREANLYLSDEDLTQLATAAGIAGISTPDVTDILERLPDAGFSAMNTGAAIAGRSHFNESRKTMLPGVEVGLFAGGHLSLLPADAYESLESIRLAWKSSAIDFLLIAQEKKIFDRCVIDYSYASIAKSIADSHDLNLIKHLRARRPEIITNFNLTIFLCNNSKSFSLLSQLYRLDPSLKASIVKFCILARIFPNDHIALHNLVFHSNTACNELILEMTNEDEHLKKTMSHWMKKADYMRELMHRYDLNFDQALALTTSVDLRRFLLQTVKDINSFIPELSLDTKANIIKHLAPLSLADAKDIILKVRHYNFVVKDIRKVAYLFEQYAANTETPLKARALSLSESLFSIRDGRHAEKTLLLEFASALDLELEQTDKTVNAKTKPKRNLFHIFAPAQTESQGNVNTLAHTRPIDHYDPQYNDLVMNQYNYLSTKLEAL